MLFGMSSTETFSTDRFGAGGSGPIRTSTLHAATANELRASPVDFL
jgi:hypothetical protein